MAPGTLKWERQRTRFFLQIRAHSALKLTVIICLFRGRNSLCSGYAVRSFIVIIIIFVIIIIIIGFSKNGWSKQKRKTQLELKLSFLTCRFSQFTKWEYFEDSDLYWQQDGSRKGLEIGMLWSTCTCVHDLFRVCSLLQLAYDWYSLFCTR